MASLTTWVTNKKVLILLIFMLMLGCLLRFYGLGRQSLWNDELASWQQGSHASIFESINRYKYDVHPPGYRMALWLAERLVGDSEVALRLPSTAAGALTVSPGALDLLKTAR